LAEVFALTKPLWEIALRATFVYVALILLVRVVPKRNAGHVSPNDMLTLIVLGSMATDGIMGGSTSVGDILLMVALVIGWSYVLDVLEYRFPLMRRLLRDRETCLIQDGRMLRRNMRREMVTEEELMSVLRKEGIEDMAEVHSAFMEADGEISIVTRGGGRER